MKTNAELIDMWEHGSIKAAPMPYFGKRNESDLTCYGLTRGTLNALLDVCRRDAWESATKAQRKLNNDAFIREGTTQTDVAPFPEKEVKP